MTSARDITSGQVRVLQLIHKEQDEATGWTPVSDKVFEHVLMPMTPCDLFETETSGETGTKRVRLTKDGESVVATYGWLP